MISPTRAPPSGGVFVTMAAMPMGRFRYVQRVGRLAVKVPRPRTFREGLRCNRWEREAWYIWRPAFQWRSLCPILFADRLGLCVVMPWAQQPVTEEQMDAAEDPEAHPSTDAEQRSRISGSWADGTVVALDYGLWDSNAVLERREYYAEMARRCERKA